MPLKTIRRTYIDRGFSSAHPLHVYGCVISLPCMFINSTHIMFYIPYMPTLSLFFTTSRWTFKPRSHAMSSFKRFEDLTPSPYAISYLLTCEVKVELVRRDMNHRRKQLSYQKLFYQKRQCFQMHVPSLKSNMD